MIHIPCKADVVIDLSTHVAVRSPSIKITERGISPGMVEIATIKRKPAMYTLVCKKCEERINNSLESVGERCFICSEIVPLSRIHYSDVGFICKDCISASAEQKQSKQKAEEEFDEEDEDIVKKRLLVLYEEVIKKSGEFPTLEELVKKGEKK
jgi:hypothetical protein